VLLALGPARTAQRRARRLARLLTAKESEGAGRPGGGGGGGARVVGPAPPPPRLPPAKDSGGPRRSGGGGDGLSPLLAAGLKARYRAPRLASPSDRDASRRAAGFQ